MNYRIVTKTGKEIIAQAFIEDPSVSSIYIFTNQLSHIQAYELFSQKEESVELKVIIEDPDKEEKPFTIFKHYTEVYGIRKSPIGTDDTVIQIWLKKEYPEDW